MRSDYENGEFNNDTRPEYGNEKLYKEYDPKPIYDSKQYKGSYDNERIYEEYVHIDSWNKISAQVFFVSKLVLRIILITNII